MVLNDRPNGRIGTVLPAAMCTAPHFAAGVRYVAPALEPVFQREACGVSAFYLTDGKPFDFRYMNGISRCRWRHVRRRAITFWYIPPNTVVFVQVQAWGASA